LLLPNPDKPEPKKRKLKAHAKSQRRKENAKVFLCDPFAPSRLVCCSQEKNVKNIKFLNVYDTLLDPGF